MTLLQLNSSIAFMERDCWCINTYLLKTLQKYILQLFSRILLSLNQLQQLNQESTENTTVVPYPDPLTWRRITRPVPWCYQLCGGRRHLRRL